jgi:hypothetical protein
MTRRELLAGCATPLLARGNEKVFAKENLVAWCIVPFDSKQRGPEERAEMLQRLGLKRLAYDWREKDTPTFDAELDALNKRGIRLEAFWLSSGMDTRANKNVGVVLDFLKRRKVRTSIWLFIGNPKNFTGLSQEQKISQMAEAAGYVAEQAKGLGCTVDLYNHGGWTGEPENLAAVVRRMKMNNTGIVYNFHHARERMDEFAGDFKLMLPHLKTLNLNGMKKGGPMIMTLGDGDRELEMLRVVYESDYRGRIGILNHRTDQDAEVGLRANMAGLERLAAKLRSTKG